MSHKEFLAYYFGYDTRDPEQLRAWQVATINKICPIMPKPKAAVKKMSHATPEELEAIQKLEKVQHDSNISADVWFD